MELPKVTNRIVYIVAPALILIGVVIGTFVGTHYASDTVVYDYQLKVETPIGDHVALQYGIWPELANIDFFQKVREGFIAGKANFIEANLTSMQVHAYKDGQLLFTVPIKSKGKEGSWWETPSGLYRAEGKEENHFSSFGHVYMPWSVPFQGNFFIHGWPYYPDGTPVKEGYSGGCIRLEDVYAKQVYEHIKVGMPILVFEEDTKNSFTYALQAPQVEAKSYLVADLGNNFVLAVSGTEAESKTALLSKLMTAVVSSEYKNIEEKIVVQEISTEDSGTKRLVAGSSYTLYDLFFPLLLEDSDEAAMAIQSYFGVNRFVTLMQGKAQALGMHTTTFLSSSKNAVSDNTTIGDIFLFLKYLYTNRPFILSMSANKTDTRTYSAPIFQDIKPVHPFLTHEAFKGGASNSNTAEVSNSTGTMEASVALVFAHPEKETSEFSEDLISVFSIPFNGEERTVGFVVLDSPSAVEDTEALLSFVQSMYH
ncbi:TPA: hypothetical protein DEP58_02505 [Patescibacteria group bacterium]|nr:MAG: Serine-type D-Ala-D-Ala carboxypeptidase [Parcubacteria group bacterium GW2011_GWD2_42_14]HCC05155.1 hypothetical protein [Patescibacteria group bacterium]